MALKVAPRPRPKMSRKVSPRFPSGPGRPSASSMRARCRSATAFTIGQAEPGSAHAGVGVPRHDLSVEAIEDALLIFRCDARTAVGYFDDDIVACSAMRANRHVDPASFGRVAQ